jgi:hypothetical protein
MQKVGMKELFGVGKARKDGTESKIKELPPMEVLQTGEGTREKWIEYSAKDALATWMVYERLKANLTEMPWVIDKKKLGTMLEFYREYLADFGELLTDMERNGIKVDTEVHLKEAEIRAREDRDRMVKTFIDWASLNCADAPYINTASTTQIQQLFFGEYKNKALVAEEKTFRIDKDETEYADEHQQVLSENPYASHKANDLKTLLKERKLKVTGKKADLIARLLEYDADLKAEEEKKRKEDVEINAAAALAAASSNGDGGEFSEAETEAETGTDAGAAGPEPTDALKDALTKRESDRYNAMPESDLTDICRAKGLPCDNKNQMIGDLVDDFLFHADMQQEKVKLDQRQLEAAKLVEPPKKYREITIKSLRLTPSDFTPTGIPQVSASVLRKMAGKNPFGEGMHALYCRCLQRTVNTMNIEQYPLLLIFV